MNCWALAATIWTFATVFLIVMASAVWLRDRGKL